jgi:toxin ParE1/3/4
MGRACDSVSLGLRRFEHGKHVVFYRIVAGGILIVRVLHQRMLPAPSRFDALG